MESPFRATLNDALTRSHARYVKLIGREYGVHWRENYYLIDRERNNNAPRYLDDTPQLFPHAATLVRGEHPFPHDEVKRAATLLISPPIFLARLTKDILAAGGQLKEARFAIREDVAALDELIVFNCTGLGSRTLFDDAALSPIRGQIVMLPPDARVDYLTHGGGDGLLYMFPRDDAIVLGGTYERESDASLGVDETTVRIVNEHRKLFAGMLHTN
jgi:D-amino-acid oxidase